MKANAIVRLKFPSEKHLETALNALKPETHKPTTNRSKACVERKGPFLILKVEAQDTVALRAALNTYLRWINSVSNVFAVLERT